MMQTNPVTEQPDVHWRQFCQQILAGQTDDLQPPVIPLGHEEGFVVFLKKHGLQSILLDLAENLEVTRLLPDSIAGQLTILRRNHVIREIYRKQHLENFLELLNEANIRCLILKGTALAYSLYPHPYQRSRLDTDILICEPDKEKLHELLINQGFTRANTVSGEVISHQVSYHQLKSDINHVYDIHWKISNSNAFAKLFSFNQLFENKNKLAELEVDGYGLDRAYTMMNLTTHYFGHPTIERDRLIWLYDVHLLAGQFSDMDWASLTRIATDRQLAPYVKRLLAVCRNQLNTRIPKESVARIENTPVKLTRIEQKRVQDEDWSRVDQFKSDWSALSLRQRIQLIREYLLPPADYILKQNNSTNMLALPYFYLKRIIEGLLKIIFNTTKN